MKQMSIQEFPFVSVVIPSVNRKNHLENCLRSLVGVDYPQSKLEIIVVDGGSSDGTIAMVKTDFENVKLLVEQKHNISYARNIGGNAAYGEIIAFTDDDCIVDKEWVRSIVHAFHNENVSAAGGSVNLLHPNLFSPNFAELPTLGLFSLGNKECSTDLLISANLAVRKKLFETLKFDLLFGQRSSLKYKWEEDVEYCNRLFDSGHKLMYVPSAIVYHDVDSQRIGFKYIISKEFFGGLSHYMVQRKRESRIILGLHSLRSLAGTLVLFYEHRSIKNFCFLIKNAAMVLASAFLFW
jgi:glycosyltransferase involved in cell wall biosynthesis